MVLGRWGGSWPFTKTNKSKLIETQRHIVFKTRDNRSLIQHTKKSVVTENRNYHGKEYRGVTEKNIVVLSSTRRASWLSAEKLPRKRASWCQGKEHRDLIKHTKRVVVESRKKLPRKRVSWWHGKENRGLIKHTKSVVVESRKKLPRKRASWWHGKEHRGLILFDQGHERASWLRAEKLKKITTEKSIVLPRKRTSWSYQEHRKEHRDESRKKNYHIKSAVVVWKSIVVSQKNTYLMQG